MTHRMVRSSGLFALLLVLSGSPMSAEACTLFGPTVEQTAREVAAKGVVVSGQIIQAFNTEKRQPEIVRVDEVFVGDAIPGEFVIDYSENAFDLEVESRRLEKEGKLLCPGFGSIHYKLGQTFERLVLIPAPAEGKWSFHRWGDTVLMGVGLEMLLDEAKRLHRLNRRPPANPQWGG